MHITANKPITNWAARTRVWSKAQTGLGQLTAPSGANGGTTLMDLGRDLIGVFGTAYLAKKGADSATYAPTIKIAPDSKTQAQIASVANTGKMLMIGAAAIGGGVLLITLLRKKRR
jgi:hypothetical protein